MARELRAARLVQSDRAVKSLVFLAVLLFAGCGARTPLSEVAAECPLDPPTCVAPPEGCDAPRTVAAVCNVATKTYECPTGSRVHERVAANEVCRPFFEEGSRIQMLGGSLVRVPTDDGRCMWIAEDARVDGEDLQSVGLFPDPNAPFGSCPRATEIVKNVTRNDDPSQRIQITGGYRLNGRTRVTYRAFRNDPGAPFGLEHLGTGLASLEGVRIVVPSTVRFGTELDLGDASLVVGEHAYVWGCPGPPEFLTERCIVGRFDASDAMELFTGSNWVASTRGRDGKTVFDAGPWVSSVTHSGASFRHIFAVGFGTNLEQHTASAPEGPWSAGSIVRACELPAGDDKAFCAGPVVHEELADPTSSALVVTYGVGTLREGPRAPADYWPRLVTIP